MIEPSIHRVIGIEPHRLALMPQLLLGKSVAIHCRAGIGRTSLVAGCLLHLLQVPYKDIFHLLSRSRGVAVPDAAEQMNWVERFARGSAGVSGS